MPCVNCHRRSGWGTAEGPVTVPPVVGSVLFAALSQGAPQIGAPRTTGQGTRPAYTDSALLHAVRDGVDPAGRTLSPTMPRYAVGEEDAAALGAHLRTLSASVSPGVTDTTVHLATIVTPEVSAARRASMLDVLRAYARFKNAGTRRETERRERGPWDMKQRYQQYRDWTLHEWELQGPPGEWRAQLEALYARDPVFAIVGGIADDDWSVVDAFCAAHKIPAVLPQTPLPPAHSADAFYSLYFSKGVTLEAGTLAHYFNDAASTKPVLQISRCGTAGEAAAAALAAAVKTRAVRSECVAPGAALTPAVWRGLLGDATSVVAWLPAADLPVLEVLVTDPALSASVAELYLSSSLLGEDAVRLPRALAGRAALVHPFVPPDQFAQHAARSLMWMKANGIAPGDRRVAVNALFAATLAADALNVPRTLGSREYFVERIEHMTSRTLTPSAYPSVTFDPVRRFGSAGSFVLQTPASPGQAFQKVQEWYVPQR
jgi:hypothetical protein